MPTDVDAQDKPGHDEAGLKPPILLSAFLSQTLRMTERGFSVTERMLSYRRMGSSTASVGQQSTFKPFFF